MADQEFLASFGVDVDESGVSRLQQILTENRTLAERLGASFNAASESVKAFKAQVSTDLPSLFSGNGYGNVTENLFGSLGGLKIGLNMTEPKKEIASFTADAKKPIDLSANAAAIVSAARTALEEVRSLFSQTFVLNVRADTTTGPTTPTPTGNRNGTEGTLPSGLSPMEQGEEDPGNRAGTTPQRMSTGGRFNRPTNVQVAEDGDAEYIIPVKKENRALPLLRQLLGELRPEARESLGGAGAKEPETEKEAEVGPELLARGNEITTAQKTVAPAAKPTVVSDQPPVFKPSQSKPVLSASAPVPAVRETLEEVNRTMISAQVAQNGPLGTGQPTSSALRAPSCPGLPPVLHWKLSTGQFPGRYEPPGEGLSVAFPSVQKQVFSDLVSRLSSVIRPSGNSVTNTSKAGRDGGSRPIRIGPVSPVPTGPGWAVAPSHRAHPSPPAHRTINLEMIIVPKSTAYIVASGIDYQYRFCGVTEIEYNFALNIDADTSQGGDIINGARRLPNQIRLSVVETDVQASPGWAASMLSALDSIRRNRVLCTVCTSMGTWTDMLLSEITATQDESNQYGWAGDLVFMQYIPRSEQYYTDSSGAGGAGGGSTTTSTRKTSNNSSTKRNTGTKAAAAIVSGDAVAAILNRAGISG